MIAFRPRLKILLIVAVWVFVGCFLAVLGDDSSSLDEDEEGGRQLREYLPETWHAVQTIPEGATGWIPRDSDGHATVYTKRRRLRKRKRRPPIVSYLDQSAETVAQVKQDHDVETQPGRGDVKLSLPNTRYGIEDIAYSVVKRRKRPNTGDPWEELQEESVRPYVRRKVTPAYQTSDELTAIPNTNFNYDPLGATIQFAPDSVSDFENVRTPYAKPTAQNRFDKENEEISFVPFTTTTRQTPKLKDILKQNGGLSLSEILQQKNITLAELLMGKKEAIKALTESSIIATSTIHSPYSEITITEKSPGKDNSDIMKYKRRPPSIALRNDNLNRRYEHYTESYESLSDKEMKEAQRKRLSLLQSASYKSAQNGKFSEVTRYEVITEPITEKRIFVPSHPKLYTSIDYKPDLEELTPDTESSLKFETSKPETTTEKLVITTTASRERTKATTITSKTPKLGVTKSKTRLPMTSAKLMKMANKKLIIDKAVSTTETVTEEENYPKTSGFVIKPLKINIKEVFGFENSLNQPKDKVPDEPLRMSIDLDTIVEASTPKEIKVTSPSTTTKIPSSKTPISIQNIPKLKPFTAKDEILEILKDPRGRAGLARILEARNMTVQELIEHRERGSSQLHLADIFHNKTKEPEPLDEAFEGRVSSEVFTSFPVFSRRPKHLANQATSEAPLENPSQDKTVLVTAFPSFKIEVPKDPANIKMAFPWQQLYPDLFHVQDKSNDEKSSTASIIPLAFNPPEMQPSDILTEEDIQRLDDLDQSLYSSASNGEPNIVDENPQKVINIPAGVKSTIIVSLGIVLLSIIVFMTILFVFRWTQKQTRLYYADSLKPPLFDVKTRNIKAFMAETLGAKTVDYYKKPLHSDEGWDRDDERKDVF